MSQRARSLVLVSAVSNSSQMGCMPWSDMDLSTRGSVPGVSVSGRAQASGFWFNPRERPNEKQKKKGALKRCQDAAGADRRRADPPSRRLRSAPAAS